MEYKIKKLEEIVESKQKFIYKLEIDNMRMKSRIEETKNLYEKVKEKNRLLISDTGHRHTRSTFDTISLNRSVKQPS